MSQVRLLDLAEYSDSTQLRRLGVRLGLQQEL